MKWGFFMLDKQTEMRLKIFGYDPYEEVNLHPYIIKLATILIKLEQNTEITRFTINEQRLLKDTKYLLESLSLRLHNVNYASVEELSNKMVNITTINQALDIINSLVEEVNPLEIPRILVPGHTMIGETQKPLALIDNDKYLRECPIIFSAITLGNNLTKLSSSTYIHEITHTQLESLKGSVKKYQNKELLPIFMEKVTSYRQDKKLFSISNKMRLRHLLECLIVLNNHYNGEKVTSKDRLDSETYVISTIKAYNLYDLYAKSNDSIRKELIKDIQAIYDQKQTLEDFLAKYDITFNEDIIKKYIP